MEMDVGSQGPQAAALLAHRIDEERGHKEADGDADGDLDHLRGNVEADGVEAVRIVLVIVSKCHTGKRRLVDSRHWKSRRL